MFEHDLYIISSTGILLLNSPTQSIFDTCVHMGKDYIAIIIVLVSSH